MTSSLKSQDAWNRFALVRLTSSFFVYRKENYILLKMSGSIFFMSVTKKLVEKAATLSNENIIQIRFI